MKTLYPLFHANFLNKFKLLLLSIIALNLTACWQVTVVKSPMESNQQADDKAKKNEKKEKSVFDSHIETIKNIPKSQKNVVEKLFSGDDEKKSKNSQTKLLPINSNLGSISYDVDSWNNSQVEPLELANFINNPELIAPVISLDENSLDFASHKATKYRFMANDAPYFDMVNSRDYLEIGWHFANINDSDEVKQASVNHAKKAYKFARQLMGEEGGQLVADILTGHVLQEKAVNKIFIAVAKCEFYSCMIVIEKNKVIQEEQAENDIEETEQSEEKQGTTNNNKATEENKEIKETAKTDE